MDEMLAQLKPLYAKQLDLMLELEDHKRIALYALNDYVDLRNQDIRDRVEREGGLHPGPLSADKISGPFKALKGLQQLNRFRGEMPWRPLGQPGIEAASQRIVPSFYSPWRKRGRALPGNDSSVPLNGQRGRGLRKPLDNFV